jgi:putative salt-induced outer membrane protein
VTNPPPKNPWDASLVLGLTLTRGNSHTLSLSGTFDADKKWDKNELHFGAQGIYADQTVEVPTTAGGTTSTNQVTSESVSGFGQYNRLLTERLYGYLRVEGLYDGIAGIDYRLTVSPGLGYYFIKNTNTTLRGELGPGFVYEKDSGADPTNYFTLRVAQKFEQKLSEHAKFWEGVEYLPQVDDFNNYLINAEVGVESSMTKKLSLQAVLQDRYRNIPTQGRVPNDLTLIAGVKYKF